MENEFYSFNDVLKELQVEKEELEELIENGEVKAYTSPKGHIQFNRSEIKTLRFIKMDQPTITVAEHNGNDNILLVDEEPLILKRQKTTFIQRLEEELDDMSPLLDMGESEATGSSYLNPSAISEISDDHASSDELIFEQLEGDEFLETGELLFDIKDTKLPGDKDVEELFPDEKFEYESEQMDNSEYIDEELSEMEEHDDDDFVRLSPKLPVHTPESYKQIQRKSSIAIILTVVSCILFIAIAMFMIYNPMNLEYLIKKIPVEIYLVKPETITLQDHIQGTLENYITTFSSPEQGKIRILKQAQETVDIKIKIAEILPPEYLEELNLIQEKIEEYKQNLYTYNKLSKLKDIRSLKIYNSLKAKYRSEKNKTAYNKLVNTRKEYARLRKQNLPKRLKSLQDKENKLYSEFAIPIYAPYQGIIESWLIEDQAIIEKQQHIATIKDIGYFQTTCEINIDKNLHYQINDIISAKFQNKTIQGTLEQIKKTNKATLLTFKFNAEDLEKNSEITYNISYTTNEFVIPTSALYTKDNKHYLMLVLQNKAVKKDVEIQEYTKIQKQDYVIVNEINENDIIINNQPDVKDGDPVIIQVPNKE
ncbi:MAG: efflux RND transporter periplasmic adaptor subunit [Planctomycetes bacterium]|nr:efflux RND transporter periplasmic adaptor subunit [Planctomycetota bacterium]HNZ65832.1 efflux RND transporter periplasmic adaptor subunit [Planctomycetota bacterium]HON43881.1 efflux RND transporter periplasmic adaptor subunit [Planctomycetota bacterium]HPY73873.1 efflux RND transporter periplasmic adaptor subunit [Planctomycetota bacterium]HQA99425.1 efflux RND transporter periplasmic adaptor subunit [Planctomycetota bacterium]